MKKKLMVIPMKGQYEQQCNAAALSKMGVPVLKSLKLKHIDKIINWIKEGKVIDVQYPDNTEEIMNKILTCHVRASNNWPLKETKKLKSVKSLRKIALKKIAARI
jgi:hypothetical protein